MTQYLVIEVDDSQVARTLVQRLRPLEPRGVRILGVFRGPERDSHCQCQRVDSRYYKPDNVIGAKFGWLLHRGCKKPVRGIHRLVNQLTLSKVRWQGDSDDYTMVPSLSLFEVPIKNMVKADATNNE